MKQPRVAYLSVEFGAHPDWPIYAGGLGVLAGDILKTASDLHYPLIGLGLFYHNGYFTQIIEDGKQREEYPYYHPRDFGMTEVYKGEFTLGDETVHYIVWRAMVGRVPLYLIDSELHENTPEWKTTTYKLYTADRAERIRQEILLGIGGAQFLREVYPGYDVWHLNEGHSAFSGLALLREFLMAGIEWDEAVKRVRKHLVFTTHTPVPAGNEVFDVSLAERYLRKWWEESGQPWERVLDLASAQTEGGLSMTVIAIRLSGLTNAVSKKHGEVSRNMWKHIFDVPRADDVPIFHITNGVHVPTWAGDQMREIVSDVGGEGWETEVDDIDFWKSVILRKNHIKLAKSLQKKRLLLYLRRMGVRWNEDDLIVGFARRVAPYKRADLIARDPDRLGKLLEQGLRIIYSGKAHPADAKGHEIIENLHATIERYGWQDKVVYVPNYNMDVASYLVGGVDLWLNNPIPPKEASGTSGQKIIYNAGLNISILDGWWIEGYDGMNGWGWEGTGDDRDAEALITLMEQAYLIYRKHKQFWWEMVEHSFLTLAPQFNTVRMFKEYIDKMYTKVKSV